MKDYGFGLGIEVQVLGSKVYCRVSFTDVSGIVGERVDPKNTP